MQQSSTFQARLEAWRVELGIGHNAFARRLGISGPYWHQIKTGQRRITPELMSLAIGRAPEPWKSALKTARQIDQEAADAAVAVA